MVLGCNRMLQRQVCVLLGSPTLGKLTWIAIGLLYFILNLWKENEKFKTKKASDDRECCVANEGRVLDFNIMQ